MGGDIRASSRVGEGSVFHCHFLARKAKADRSELLPSVLQGKRVAIVDEHPEATDAAALLLESFGLEAVSVTTADAQTPFQPWGSFDLALLDVQQPAEVLRHTLEAMAANGLPCITMAPVGLHYSLPTIEQSGVHLSKPIRRGHTLKAILTALGAEQAHALPRNLSPKDKHDGCGEQVLLAEDNLVNQRIATLMLQRIGYQVDVVETGLAAVRAQREHDYSLILMDVMMPEMDGLQATRLIRQETTRPRPWIIALTAGAMEGDREKCLDAGMDGFVTKPIDLHSLIDVLQRNPRAKAG